MTDTTDVIVEPSSADGGEPPAGGSDTVTRRTSRPPDPDAQAGRLVVGFRRVHRGRGHRRASRSAH